MKTDKRIILIGRSGSGKTTLSQALRGEKLHYEKTQAVSYGAELIDTPGEYAENHELSHALALYSYEADVVGLLLSATEPYSLYAPNITQMANREVVGIITKADHPDARVDRARRWLELAGCREIFVTSSYQNQGIAELSAFLRGDSKKKQQKN